MTASAEIAAMRFVARTTMIPVPRLWFSFRWKQYTYLFMTRIPGTTLQDAWETLPEEFQKSILLQLSTYLAQLRALRSPYGPRVCSAAGGSFTDYRVTKSRGPFSNQEAFNDAVRYTLPLDRTDLVSATLIASHSIHRSIVFTHGDLTPRNIMIQGSHITAIIDWGCAGWFPDHWEYLKARWGEPHRGYWRRLLLQSAFMPEYEDDAKADDELGLYWAPTMALV